VFWVMRSSWSSNGSLVLDDMYPPPPTKRVKVQQANRLAVDLTALAGVLNIKVRRLPDSTSLI
jgi:hypothetical protein